MPSCGCWVWLRNQESSVWINVPWRMRTGGLVSPLGQNLPGSSRDTSHRAPQRQGKAQGAHFTSAPAHSSISLELRGACAAPGTVSPSTDKALQGFRLYSNSLGQSIPQVLSKHLLDEFIKSWVLTGWCNHPEGSKCWGPSIPSRQGGQETRLSPNRSENN